MNATVARIVEIMFQDTVMNDEVQALKDEVMNNCQERYVDMLARGMNEDDAIAAVVDSLKGMEEVLAQYPRIHAAQQIVDDEDTDADVAFAAHMVDKVKVLLTADEVNFESSFDDHVHVYYDREAMPSLRVKLHNNTLVIDRDPAIEFRNHQEEQQAQVQHEQKSEWKSFSEFIADIGKMLGNIKVNINFNHSGEVTIAVPDDHPVDLELHTTSGDVNVDGIRVRELHAETTSGDVTVELEADVCPQRLHVKGASGDVDINGNAACLNVQTVSGDVEYMGSCPDINVGTVSGDVELDGVMQDVHLKTISGDAQLRVQGETLHEVDCKTTSGDITVRVPDALRNSIGLQMHTVSGDVRNRVGEVIGTPRAYVHVQSVSGDVTLC